MLALDQMNEVMLVTEGGLRRLLVALVVCHFLHSIYRVVEEVNFDFVVFLKQRLVVLVYHGRVANAAVYLAVLGFLHDFGHAIGVLRVFFPLRLLPRKLV